MKTRTLLPGLLVVGMIASGSTNATLMDRGGGLIYDDELNITWLQDANYARTSGYDADGRMNWNAANFWARSLTYGGYSDWRLPTADESCYGYNCTGSEFGYLFYFILEVHAGHSILTSQSTDFGLLNNIQTSSYWTGTPYAQRPDLLAWSFDTSGVQRTEYLQYNEFYAWAVRDGDIAAIPEPNSLALGSLAIGGLALLVRKREKRSPQANQKSVWI